MTVTPAAVAFPVVSFVAGVLVGVLWRDAWAVTRTGHTVVMARLEIRPRTIGITLVVLALAVNMLLGFLLITTRAQNRHAEDARTALISCQGRYNRALGAALAERDRRASTSTAANLEWLKALGDTLSRPEGPSRLPELLEQIRVYRSSLVHVQEGRIRSPYPNPDLCRE